MCVTTLRDVSTTTAPRHDVAALRDRIRAALAELSVLPSFQFDPAAFQFSSDLEAVKRLLIERGWTSAADLQERSLDVQAERLEAALASVKAPRLISARV